MNTMIPLGINMPNFADTMMRSNAGYQQQQEVQNANALRQFMQEHGAAIAQGDPAALNALAQLDPKASIDIQSGRLGLEEQKLGMQSTRQGMSDSAERLQIARDEAKRGAAEYALKMSDHERTQKAEEGKNVAAAATVAWRGGPESWDKWNDQFPEYENISFKEAPTAIARITGAAEGFEAPEEPAAIQGLRIRAEEAGYEPGTPAYQNFMAEGDRPKTTITNTIGGEQILPKTSPGVVNVPQSDGTFTQAPVTGGPQTQTPAELAARVGLADDSIKQLPEIIKRAEAGDLTGALDWLNGRGGWGKQGESRRENMAASEAITRMLTGAGMPASEAEREKDLYIIGPLDTKESAVSKLKQLDRRLKALSAAAKVGRTGVPVDPKTGFGIPDGGESGAPDDWMTNTDVTKWTEEQMLEAERIWGLAK